MNSLLLALNRSPSWLTGWPWLRSRLGLAMAVAVFLLACSADDFPEGNLADFPGTPTSSSAGAGAEPHDAVKARLQPERLEQPSSMHDAKASAPRARGLWVLAEGSVRVLDDPTRIEKLLARADALHATDLFVQVYRGGRAFYEGADYVERKPRPAAQNVDVLGELIAAAHERGLRVHAWVNVLSLSTRRDAQLIRDLGPEAIMVDRQGRSVLDYPNFDLPEPDRRFYRMGTPGLYLDPAIPAVRSALVTTFRDLLTRYPELDGLHLDYIRHPGVLPFSPGSRFGVGLDFGYGEMSRARYRLETGHPDPIDGAKPGMVRAATQWDDWRRQQVTRLVEEIGRETRAVRPGLLISAAVIPYFDRAYLSLAQDWRRWLESGAIDLAMPMVYTLDDRLLRYQLETFAGWPEAERIWPGLGTWLFSDRPGRATAQLDVLQRAGFPGEMFFSDDAISESDELLEALSGVPVNP